MRINESFGASFIGSTGPSTPPPIGMGLIYKIEIERLGLPSAEYIGATTRPIDTRAKEHIRNAMSLGVINPNGGGQGKDFWFTTSNPLYAIIRTAMGLTQTRSERAYMKYFSVTPVGAFSLFSLADAENHFIQESWRQPQNHRSFAGQYNYDSVHTAITLNDPNRAGAGISAYSQNSSVRSIAAYIHLKDEGAGAHITTPDELEKALLKLVNGAGGKTSIESIYHYISGWLSLKDYFFASIASSSKPYRSRSLLSAQFSALLRRKGNASYSGLSLKDAQKVFQEVWVRMDKASLFDHFRGGRKAGIVDIEKAHNDMVSETVSAIVDGFYEEWMNNKR